MQRIIYLIRHGPPQYPIAADGRRCVYGPSAPLSLNGRQKCLALADAIRQRDHAPPTLLVTSPLLRARQTAEVLAESFGATRVISDDRLRDTESAWEGVPVDEFLDVFAQGRTFADPRTRETIEHIGKRMLAVFDDTLTRFADERLAFISHGDPLRALYFQLSQPHAPYPPYPDLVRLISLDTAQGVRLQQSERGRVTTAGSEYVPTQPESP